MDNYDPDIVTVVDDDGKEHEFEVLDRIEADDDKKYIAMIPVFEGGEDVLDDSGELIILRVVEENGETYLEPIEDEMNSMRSERSLRTVFRKCLNLTRKKKRTNKPQQKTK